jgi:hypothetical protein
MPRRKKPCSKYGAEIILTKDGCIRRADGSPLRDVGSASKSYRLGTINKADIPIGKLYLRGAAQWDEQAKAKIIKWLKSEIECLRCSEGYVLDYTSYYWPEPQTEYIKALEEKDVLNGVFNDINRPFNPTDLPL